MLHWKAPSPILSRQLEHLCRISCNDKSKSYKPIVEHPISWTIIKKGRDSGMWSAYLLPSNEQPHLMLNHHTKTKCTRLRNTAAQECKTYPRMQLQDNQIDGNHLRPLSLSFCLGHKRAVPHWGQQDREGKDQASRLFGCSSVRDERHG